MRTHAKPTPCARLRSWRPESRPWWSWTGLGLIAILALALFTWGLSRNGMGNEYYAAAVKSEAVSWKAWFFGSLDPGSFITVDKLPAALWLEGLSARLFGFSSWSMLLPQALAGVASVLIVYRLVRRWQGDVAGLLAALAFALTPVAVVMFRFNNPDALLTLLLLTAAWASLVGPGEGIHLEAHGLRCPGGLRVSHQDARSLGGSARLRPRLSGVWPSQAGTQAAPGVGRHGRAGRRRRLVGGRRGIVAGGESALYRREHQQLGPRPGLQS